MGPLAWDALRGDETQPSFAIPDEREEWRRCCHERALVARGAAVASLASKVGASTLASFGVGTACVEYQIHRADPTLRLHLSDFSRETVRRLRSVFPEAASIDTVDLLKDELPHCEQSLTVLHRIDTEFTDAQLRTVFTRLHNGGHRFVLVVPTAFLTLRELAVELRRRAMGRFMRRPITFVGYLRTRAVYSTFWTDLYRLRSEGVMAGSRYLLLEAVSKT